MSIEGPREAREAGELCLDIRCENLLDSRGHAFVDAIGGCGAPKAPEPVGAKSRNPLHTESVRGSCTAPVFLDQQRWFAPTQEV
jgi:hypothetical protein